MKLENGVSFADYGVTPSPGIDAALSGFWQGRNRADNESQKPPVDTKKTEAEKQKQRERYKGSD